MTEPAELVRRAQLLLTEALLRLDAPNAETGVTAGLADNDRERVLKLGAVAARHLDEQGETGTSIPLSRSLEIRRELFGRDRVQATANLFGRNGAASREILYRDVAYGERRRVDQPVRLSDEGIRIARLWRELQSQR